MKRRKHDCCCCHCDEVPQIICILDRSGSMETVRGTAIEQFNKFLREQKRQKDAASLKVVLFDDEYIVFHLGSLHDCPRLTTDTYVPRGMTALYDAIGRSIDACDARKALVVILTDGFENDSRNYTYKQISDLIKRKRESGWEFVYLGANQDAWKVGTGLNIPFTMTITGDTAGIQKSFDVYHNVVSSYRDTGTMANASVNWDKQESTTDAKRG